MTNISFPKKLKFLLHEQARYKSACGGRGSGKSWAFAGALLLKGLEKQQRFLCTRELQKSIKDSVHQLLADLIVKMDLQHFYEVQTSGIFGINGTRFGFEGLRHNTVNLKSWEGADVCWVEEAQVVSNNSWDILIPTIRQEGSEIWLSWNPDLEEDPTYQRFVVNPPKDLIHIQINYNDNPFFPKVLKQEMAELKEKDYESYLNVWEGKCRSAVAGAIFAKEMEEATRAKPPRITEVAYDQRKAVNTYWDLGHSDLTAIWFVQFVGMEYRVLRYYSNSQQKMGHYIKYLQSLDYVYGKHYLPHDAKSEQLGMDMTIERQAKQSLGNIVIVPRCQFKADAIEAARSVFSLCYFDKELCADGLTALRRYAYKVDKETGRVSRDPEHNIWSHGADAWLTFGQSKKLPKVPKMITRPKSDAWWA